MAIIVLITSKNKSEAKKIARFLLEKRLAACVNIVPRVTSLFWWEGKIDQTAETLLIVKTKKKVFCELSAAVKSAHSYSVPEIIAVSIKDGLPDYLKWIDDSLKVKKK